MIKDKTLRTLFILYMYSLTGGLLFGQKIPEALNDLDSFPGVKLCTVTMHSFPGTDTTVDPEGYVMERMTFLPDGRKTGHIMVYDNTSYADSTMDSVYYSVDGLMIKEIKYANYYPSGKQNRTETKTINKEGYVVTSVAYLDREGWVGTKFYAYNQKGLLSQYKDSTRDWVTVSIYHYDSMGRMIKKVTDSKPYVFTDSILYNKDGSVMTYFKMITSTRVVQQDTITKTVCGERTDYRYENGKVVWRENYRLSFTTRNSTFRYDEQDRLISETVVAADSSYNSSTTYEYDRLGNLSRHRQVEARSDYDIMWTVQYNTSGLPVRAEQLYNNTSVNVYVWEYVYY